ncbi:ribosomal protein L23 [Candidatus Hydrogenisulfobacillus filiaventi]|uniref:Large ribosomal subunit protein uL23 n=1 Tax=Candidatus Hydrogenisulfobacillus filiaventi TaxID=2707344 RepID=A0A6F8ZJI5_9FIRM|nr:50S ribosomal protein L23 [Bacillota bacterium]CAB1129946.1 ribosomal protein L23 [Candidatus Hydrogenisulfobacillus filiaventi]
MKDPHDILIRPVITEESTDRMALGQYTFEVAPDANKIEIRQAVEAIFRVHVTKVNTMWDRGKTRRRGGKVTREPDRKRAIVSLKPGESIELFETR